MTTIFYESDHFHALYDIKPVVRGHVLLVSKRHVSDFLELTSEEMLDLRSAMKLIIPKILEIYGASEGSYNMTSQIGKYSGRTVDHFHLHIIPRSHMDPYQSDSIRIYTDLAENATKSTEGEVVAETERLRKEFGYKRQSQQRV